MKRMLINATQKEEFRVALVDGQKLFELDIDTPENDQQKSNIYKGVITTISPSLDAAFVSYGGEKDGFLAMKDVSREYFPKDYVFNGKPSIKDVLYEGQEIIVQINKDIRGNKGAALTTYISLAGSYLVLMPNNPRAGGISRRIEGEDRQQLKAALSSLALPKGMGLIVRTACLGKTTEELDADLKTLLRYWDAIKIESDARKAPFLIHKESDILTRSFRDHLRSDIGEILIDNKEMLEAAKKRIISLGRNEYLNRLKLYSGEGSLFSHYQIESQIEAALLREVRLPSGGSIVIDTTEALTAIDINSAKSTRGGDIEETAFHTNLEAADEIAKQLRLRDLGGLIVIDFIDMTPIEHHRQVELRFKDAVKNDRARIQMTKLSRFGLLELSRQRLHPSLRESTHHICPRCSGMGTIRDDDSLSLSILRVIGEEALKEKTAQVQVIVPVKIASYLLNEKRPEIARIEKESKIVVIIAPDPQMETPHYNVTRLRHGEEIRTISYMLPQLLHDHDKTEVIEAPEIISEQVAALPGIVDMPSTEKSVAKPIAAEKPKQKANVFSRAISGFKGLFHKPVIEAEPIIIKEEKAPEKRTRPSRSKPASTTNRRNATAPKTRNEQAIRTNKPLPEKVRREKSKPIPAAEAENMPEKKIAPVAPKVTEQPDAVKTRRTQRTLSQPVRMNKTKIAVETIKTNDVESAAQVIPAAVDHTAQKAVVESTQPEMKREAVVKTPVVTLPKKIETPIKEENTNAPEKTVVETPVTTQETTMSERNEVRRSRRSPRHLRLTSQRRRRSEQQLKQSPMPLMFAAASPELASGKVWIDMKSYFMYHNVHTTDETQSETGFVTIDEKQAPLITHQTPSIEVENTETIVTIQMNETPTSLTTEETSQKTPETKPLIIDPIDEVSQKTVATIGFASSPMAKPQKAPETHIEIKESQWERSPFIFSGKGAAGAHSAENRSSSDMNKPHS